MYGNYNLNSSLPNLKTFTAIIKTHFCIKSKSFSEPLKQLLTLSTTNNNATNINDTKIILATYSLCFKRVNSLMKNTYKESMYRNAHMEDNLHYFLHPFLYNPLPVLLYFHRAEENIVLNGREETTVYGLKEVVEHVYTDA